jgi:OOP family OmpA-OmpF porin
MSSFRTLFLQVTAATALGFTGHITAYAQQPSRALLFGQADQARERALEARADILAPESYGQAMRRYQEAERDLERGRSVEDIEERLDAAEAYFDQASELARMAYPILSSALAARDDADEAGAATSASQIWSEASETFERAAREHEGGDVNDARQRAGEAESLFRRAELEAIKADYLQETWELLRQARQSDVHKRAPKTFALAEELAAEAERLLSENRYDTDQPRWLAQQAKMQAMHAIYLGTIIRAVEKKEMTFEDVILAGEEELARIAAVMELAPSFQTGMSETADTIISEVRAYQDSLARLDRDLRDRDEQVDALELRVAEVVARLSEVEQEMGGLEEERTALLARMEDQARMRQKFTTVERMFSGEEARVFREGGDVTIRLTGLTFPVGGARIGSQFHDLLDRVQRAILEFPGARVSVEGHTDSFGSDRANQRLSQERAEAVRTYLLGNPGLQPSQIEAVGYGESRPVASNDTVEGRARNRRTDIVIHTGLGIGY